MTPLNLAPYRLDPPEIAAFLHILLAYPTVKPERTKKLIESIRSDRFAMLRHDAPDEAPLLLEQFPALAGGNRTERKGIIANFEEAQRVGAVVLVLIRDTVPSLHPRTGGKRISIDFATRALWPRLPGEDRERYEYRLHDIERRQIRPRYPFAHLAAALAYLARERAASGKDMAFYYTDLGFLRRWVAKANEIAGYIRATGGLERMAEQLVDIDWQECRTGFCPSTGILMRY
ncbi:hypothetical protein [uncultured Sphingosinicella sp.]|uniref:hypothetical protein n=1 Tax=uncultured Sphingosinicella sp. TaxID=478748 RepID=UPI0030DD5AEE|tara:strand:+ start:25469 stop:26164 length:696 start_codon:yes stop_codon:yes gene_type:complete